MLLTITSTHAPATDLSFLLHKHPDRFQSFPLKFGKAHVYYPEATERTCSVCLLLDIDSVKLVRGGGDWKSGRASQYVNDRPYVASSMMSVAIAQVFSSALSGRSADRPELASKAIPLRATIDVLPVRGGIELLERIFRPLGYNVTARSIPLDSQRPDWGKSPYYHVELEQTVPLCQLLQHLYVLMPVFDGKKHYYIGQDEVEKLLSKGEAWLEAHPEKELIANRYLFRRKSLVRQALSRLIEDNFDEPEGLQAADRHSCETEQSDTSDAGDIPGNLHEQRLDSVLDALVESGAKRVVDLGCGEGKLLRKLLGKKQFEEILGVDVSIRSLEVANNRLKIDRLPPMQQQRIKLLHGALTYRDTRLHDYDAAAVVEVIEHLDLPRVRAFERMLFEHARPRTVVLTTPNREYNVRWDALPADKLRHSDHRFEWTREEFQAWAEKVCHRFNYRVHFAPVGPEDESVGAPSQMAIFHRDA